MCKLILVTSLIIGYAYGTEAVHGLVCGQCVRAVHVSQPDGRALRLVFRDMVLCNVLIPQLFWFRWFRTTPWAMFILSLFVNVGMWFERFVIVTTSLHRDFLPSSWKMFYPTWVITCSSWGASACSRRSS